MSHIWGAHKTKSSGIVPYLVYPKTLDKFLEETTVLAKYCGIPKRGRYKGGG